MKELGVFSVGTTVQKTELQAADYAQLQTKISINWERLRLQDLYHLNRPISFKITMVTKLFQSH